MSEERKIVECENWDRHLKQFDVLKAVITDFIKEYVDLETSLSKLQKLVIRDIKKLYPDVDYFDTEDLNQSTSDVFAEKREHAYKLIMQGVVR